MRDLPPEFEEVIKLGFKSNSDYFLTKNEISICYNDNNKYSIFKNRKFKEEVCNKKLIEKLKLYDNK